MDNKMDGPGLSPDEQLDPPTRIVERLRQISGYTWDESKKPLHSSYDDWQFLGRRFISPYSTACTAAVTPPTSNMGASSSSMVRMTNASSNRTTPGSEHSSLVVGHYDGFPTGEQASLNESNGGMCQLIEEQVVARVSSHVLREERGFHIAKNVMSADRDGKHMLAPLDLIRLSPLPGDRSQLVVAIYRSPGRNALHKLLDMGPAWYYGKKQDDRWVADIGNTVQLAPPISLAHFLDFAVGASECLEMIHHGQGLLHGEIRGDAFHYGAEDGQVKLVTFGSGLRSFEYGLTSTGWSSLSKELGAKNKLLYISPEQTGRMPAEPDTRTDIYSLGVLLWSLLTQRPVFEGETPLDIVQGVLGRRIANVSAYRMDVPDVVGRILLKCTAKSVGERYHSASGLRHDFVKVRQFLGDGGDAALAKWQIACKDVSSFFMLPTMMIGREQERAELAKVIERVAKSHAMSHKGGSDCSGQCNERFDGGDGSSEGASSTDGPQRRSISQNVGVDTRKQSGSSSLANDSAGPSGDTVSSATSKPSVRSSRAWGDRHQSITMETRCVAESVTGASDASCSVSRQLGPAKFGRPGHCEIVTIEGAGGLGKSCLVQCVLAESRRRGYSATAKFDAARKTAYGPLLRLLGSLFRQVWGERNTETPFHQALKQYVRPMWPKLHKTLGLPEFLLGAGDAAGRSAPASSAGAPLPMRGSSPDTAGSPRNKTSAVLRAGAPAKSIRLITTFLDVLRMFTHHKFICFCLDDLHFADAESLELISQIIAARLTMVMIVTYRPEELSRERVQNILHPPEPDERPRPAAHVTKITLEPLTEANIVQYVSTTMCRRKEEVLPLALVIQSKTAGNPFYMREMLTACHRKKCIWHDYKDGTWNYDLDKLFAQFQGEEEYDVLDTAFITRRLSELPPAARSILAWGALMGHSFSFGLVSKLLGGDGQDANEGGARAAQQEAVAGLQAAIQAYILVPSDAGDRFRFAHDRYIQAARALAECRPRHMHFRIAQTLMRTTLQDSAASHICECVQLIKQLVPRRRAYRDVLLECARDATANGARPTAAKYYSNAVTLLQPNAWDEAVEDVWYSETMQLHLGAAECYLYMGTNSAAMALLENVFGSARSAADKAPAYVLQSRIWSQMGDTTGAFACLSRCLEALGGDDDDEPTSWHDCDDAFRRLVVRIKATDAADVLEPPGLRPASAVLGAVLAEAASAAWWSDCLSFYRLALRMVRMHLDVGPFPQSAMGFLLLAIVAVARFSMVDFAVELGGVFLTLLDKTREPVSMARGYLLYAAHVSVLHRPVSAAVDVVERALDHAAVFGDRSCTILGYGVLAMLKFFAGHHCSELEAFCHYGCEDVPNWHLDSRGGTFLIAARQLSRALQGKTRSHLAPDVMSDDLHHAASYKKWLAENSNNGGRSLLIYETLEMVPLFLFGHYEAAVSMGQACVARAGLLWGACYTQLAVFFYGLALAGLVLRRQHDPRPTDADVAGPVGDTVDRIRALQHNMCDWRAGCNVHYLTWSRLLDAQISELLGDQGGAVHKYEEALDHAAENGFLFEEALGNYLMASGFIRHTARRSAMSALRDAVGLYRQFGATGIAVGIEREHSLLLHGPIRNPRIAEAATQTDFVGDSAPVQYLAVDGEHGPNPQQASQAADVAALKGERVSAWRGSMQAAAGAGLPALDMIDLHAILVSSQVISSVLQVDELLKTMCDVVLQTCGGSASLAAIVVQDEGSVDWCVAASGNPERGADFHKPGIPLSGTHLVAENVVLYCTRFREIVFLRDLTGDERFGNVAETWLQRNPTSKAVIAIPICHGQKPLLGVLYLEGAAGSFTDRNATVLQLLVNQIGISYANALAMKAVEKVSAENTSMLAMQKRALTQALAAETKAKHAEAEAKRNVKLAEEAAKAKSIFLANVSHELRTPLNGVIGNSELLRGSNLNKEQLEMADSIRVSADLLLTVINDILDFSRMEADKMKLYMIAFNPEEMVREVVRAVSYSNREKASKKNVEIVQDVNLPPMLIYGDPIRLHQVLGNLISNSLKFTEVGSITIGARVDQLSALGATLTFWVRDTGIGIAPDQLTKLFQPFSQADASTARKYGGSGLGLSICKTLIETMMKGTIRLESEKNEGTTVLFTVRFDKAKPEVVAGDAQTAIPPQPPVVNPRPRASVSASSVVGAPGAEPSPKPCLDLSTVPHGSIRICVAEDNAINARIATQYLARLGYASVDTYDNGQKAVDGLRREAREGSPYHVVLMDVMMPVMDGYQATKLLRADAVDAVRNVLVIAMTASAIQGDREKCLAAGMNDYLAKPVRSDVLKKKLESYLGPASVASFDRKKLAAHPVDRRTDPPQQPTHLPAVDEALLPPVGSLARMPLGADASINSTPRVSSSLATTMRVLPGNIISPTLDGAPTLCITSHPDPP